MRTSALALVGAALLAAGCASIDWDAPKTHTTALARPPSPSLASAFDAHPEESGFLLLTDGIDAFGARLLMANHAQASIDAQYYFILDDVTGHVFFRELLKAADRGVRVRLLLDDIATQGYDPGLAALDSHPHFEVRIFNPFTRSKGRLFSGVSEFGRVNRRMHNKSFTVDGIATVIGGRNIGAEYFAAREDMNFGDLDVLGFGPVARDAGSAFDDYWNSEAAVPVSVLVARPADPLVALAKGPSQPSTGRNTARPWRARSWNRWSWSRTSCNGRRPGSSTTRRRSPARAPGPMTPWPTSCGPRCARPSRKRTRSYWWSRHTSSPSIAAWPACAPYRSGACARRW
jgi:phosphatidylserine/phosphatidylglycerophosphate/cardiolipin synthase-like enzyme